MKINLKIFLPPLSDVIGRKQLEVDFAGETIYDLIEYLASQYGRKARQALYDEKGELDPVVQILLNGEEWVTGDRLDKVLQENDDVMLLMMMAGG